MGTIDDYRCRTFVPSRGGISRNPREHAGDDQRVDRANVLPDVVRRRLAAG
ncbi:hypothetical protein [Burkholderia sp. SCN-KJ]|uniref:hypothetical protein n=1 Tax=Burkholderia sp. SCN-KJ TaxID=2969248 RepID=UPI0021504DFB|nr:hypothetical protein [Burkholderia sp. SCN-KJ]MCR4469963.1 hypothetical protein [Burkholderia sp. SCN-KJ]